MKLESGRRLMPNIMLLLAVAAVGCVIMGATNDRSTRVAVVDINQVIEKSTYVQNRIAEISGDAKDWSVKLEAKGKEYEAERMKLDSQRALLNESEIQTRMEQLQKLSDEFDELKFYLNRELQKAQERGLGPVRENIQGMIEDLARVRGIDLVLSSSNAVYHSPQIDLTADIIASLDK